MGWVGPDKKTCGSCQGTGVGYACACFKCDGRGWRYRDKAREQQFDDERIAAIRKRAAELEDDA